MAKSQKIRIRLKAYDHKALDQSATKIVETAKRPVLKYLVRFPFLLKKYLYYSAFPACKQRFS